MRLFGELGWCEYSVGIIRRFEQWHADDSFYEFVLVDGQDAESYMHVKKNELYRLMRDAEVRSPEELIGCEVVTKKLPNPTNATMNRAVLPKGTHVELSAIDEKGKNREIQFKQY